MRIINRLEADSLMSDATCLEVIESAFVEYAREQVRQPQRYVIPLSGAHDELMVMPAAMQGSNAFGAKLISLLPGNPQHGLPTVQGAIALFDYETGKIAGLIDAASITVYRTAAASAVATKYLSRLDSKILGILGTGQLVIPHVTAISQVRDIQSVVLWGRDNNKTEEKAEMLRKLFPDISIEIASTIDRVISRSDILCTLTGAHEAIVTGEILQAGMHINAVGAHNPNHRELDGKAVQMARCYIDFHELAFVEAGEFILAEKEYFIERKHVIGDIGDVLIKKVEARRNSEEITLFKSLGGAVEDIALATHLLRLAEQKKIGTEIAF